MAPSDNEAATPLTNALPAKLSGADAKELVEALISAFPNRSTLAQMVRFELERNLDDIAPVAGIRETMFALFTDAEAQGYVPALLAAAVATRPASPALLAIARKHSLLLPSVEPTESRPDASAARGEKGAPAMAITSRLEEPVTTVAEGTAFTPSAPSAWPRAPSAPHDGLPAIISPFGNGAVGPELQLLPELYFVDTEFARKAKSDKVNLIIGRRGAGKSALAHWLGLPRDSRSRHYNVYVNISDLAVIAPTVTGLADKLRQENHAKETLASAWRVALLHALMVETLKDKHLAGQAGSFDMDSHLITKMIPRNKSASEVVRRVFEIVAMSLAPGVSKAASVVTAVQQLCGSPGFVTWLRALPEYLRSSKQRAVIVIDTLEEYRIKDEAVVVAMTALLHATTELSAELADAVGGGASNAEIKLFLPAEVAQSLEDRVLNIGKSFERALYMHWRRKDLLRLTCWRLMYHLTHEYKGLCPSDMSRYRGLDWSDSGAVAKAVWDRLFPEVRLGDRQINSFAHISRFTQLRPRQFVMLCNAIVQGAYEEGRFWRMQQKDISAGIAASIDTLATEVLSSFRNVFSEVDRVVRTLTTVRDPASVLTGLSYGTVDSLASQVKGICTREDFWRVLLEAGVIGLVVRDDDAFVEARFEYIVKQPLIPNPQDRFVVHPMFYGRLGIQPPASIKPVFPLGPEDLSIEF